MTVRGESTKPRRETGAWSREDLRRTRAVHRRSEGRARRPQAYRNSRSALAAEGSWIIRAILDCDRHIDNQLTLRRIEASIVDLNDPVALLLVELQDPSVEIIPLISDVLLDHPGGENKPAITEIAPHKLRLHAVMNGEPFRELRLLLIVDILVGTPIAQAE